MFDLFYPAAGTNTGRGVIKSLQMGANRAGIDAEMKDHHAPRPGSTLITYGAGGADRLPYFRAHPGKAVAWDLGYWERDNPDKRARKYRVSIGDLHCPKLIMKGPAPSPGRFESAGLRTGEVADSGGFILLVGNSPKSIFAGAGDWTARMAQAVRDVFPRRRVLYRPKPGRAQEEAGVDHDGVSSAPIEQALEGCALVVCRHSNVAVDACRLGVPVVCTDGAAAAIYPRTFDGDQPTEATRSEFLHRLAWWQWTRYEMEDGTAWSWLKETLHAN